MTYASLKAKHAERIRGIMNQYKTSQVFRMFADHDTGKFLGFLYKPFLEELAENVSEILSSLDEWDQREVYNLYVGYEDDNLTYDDVPDEIKVECLEV